MFTLVNHAMQFADHALENVYFSQSFNSTDCTQNILVVCHGVCTYLFVPKLEVVKSNLYISRHFFR